MSCRVKLYFVVGFIVLLHSALPCQNKQIRDEKNGNQMLIGTCTREAFNDTSFSSWFSTEYDAYTPNDSVVNQLKDKLTDIRIKIIMGTWCSDSKTQIPDLYKLLDELHFSDSTIEIICVDRKKLGLADELKGLNIEKVPTIIFYRNEKEIGRIIETPVQTLEKDILGFIE